jgi:hypothetical protein
MWRWLLRQKWHGYIARHFNGGFHLHELCNQTQSSISTASLITKSYNSKQLSRFSFAQKQVIGAFAINNPLCCWVLPVTKSAPIEGLSKHLRSELRTLEAIFLHDAALSLAPHLSGEPATYSLQRILSVIRR